MTLVKGELIGESCQAGNAAGFLSSFEGNMASTGGCPFSPCGILSKLGLVPGGNGGTCSKAITVIGGTSYVALAVNMFNPDLVNR